MTDSKAPFPLMTSTRGNPLPDPIGMLAVESGPGGDFYRPVVLFPFVETLPCRDMPQLCFHHWSPVHAEALPTCQGYASREEAEAILARYLDGHAIADGGSRWDDRALCWDDYDAPERGPSGGWGRDSRETCDYGT
jgi:hypothetical protein